MEMDNGEVGTLAIPLLIKQIDSRIKKKMDAHMKMWNLTSSQARVLHFLDQNGGSASQKEIEDHLGVSHPTVAGLVSRLEKNGFVMVSVSENDRRNKVVTFGKKAQEHGVSIQKQQMELEQQLMKGFSEMEKEEMSRLLLKMFDNIANWDEIGKD